MWEQTMRDVVLPVVAIALALFGFALFVLGRGDAREGGWVIWGLGLVLCSTAVLGARSLFRGESPQAAALLVLPAVGGAAFLLGLYHALGAALCDSGNRADPPGNAARPDLRRVGAGRSRAGYGARWLWRSRGDRTEL